MASPLDYSYARFIKEKRGKDKFLKRGVLMPNSKVSNNPLYTLKEFLFGWAGLTLVVIWTGIN
ncbi:MAG: hypothetical protein D4R73_03795 [Deltaproteobacteria bacterium]|nr:MAG: hypothetical protein D4R73_03795 [Deltaproteobacteria bacterium]